MSDSRFATAYPRQLAEAEAKQVGKRRVAAAETEPTEAKPADGTIAQAKPSPTVGVALSGGGIRSATFCLGVFRALARQKLVERIDFLSTVSGGGYFGSFLGGLFQPRPSGQPRPTTAEIRRELLDLRSPAVDWLRENGRYMSPNGAGDTLLAGAVLLRNWAAVLLVVSSFAFTLFTLTRWLGLGLDAWWATARHSPLFAAIDQTVRSTPLMPEARILLVSPYLVLPVAFLFLTVVPLGSAFWLTQRFGFTRWSARFTPFVFAGLPLLAVMLSEQRDTVWGQLIMLESAAALLCYAIAYAIGIVQGQGSGERLMRNRLSRWLSANLWAAVALLLFAALDTLGRTLADSMHRDWALRAAGSGGVAVLAAFTALQKALPLLGSPGSEKRMSLRPMLLAGAASVVVAGGLLIGVSMLAHKAPERLLGQLALCGATVTLAFGWTVPFLNLSSHNSLYGARLTRAYLGASNRKRRQGQVTITELVAGDQILLSDYDPPAAGGPLHLINVTLNETVSGKSQIEQRDRKGLPMAVGPCGISVGSRHHALWDERERGRKLQAVPPPSDAPARFQIFTAPKDESIEVEELDLGSWVSISGAAFSTGLGARTSLAMSLLLGLANVRLGHWWDCGINPGDRGAREPPIARIGRFFSEMLPVHAYLLDELLARFHGPARRRWYLSDGGHFENTGAYELIRRRVPFIVICDSGCDPGYVFEDLANLTRRVRLDFDAELTVFTADQLGQVLPKELRPYFGAIEDFAPGRKGDKPHALLAAVFYEDPLREQDPASVIVILKPSVSGDEPPDVVEYGKTHASFPQEPTSDQFFDEAQWESYRRLGEHIASRVFEDVAAGWRPLDFRPPPLDGLRWRGASASLGGEDVGGKTAVGDLPPTPG